MNGRGWQIVEGPNFDQGAMECGGHAAIEEIIAPIKYALSRDPTGFPQVEGIGVATTKLRMNGPDFQLSHTVWFRIHHQDRFVTLLYVSVTMPDDMGDEDEDF